MQPAEPLAGPARRAGRGTRKDADRGRVKMFRCASSPADAGSASLFGPHRAESGGGNCRRSHVVGHGMAAAIPASCSPRFRRVSCGDPADAVPKALGFQ